MVPLESMDETKVPTENHLRPLMLGNQPAPLERK
jgi:hypothetical protein